MKTTPSVILFASHAAGGIREVFENIALGLGERGHACHLHALYPVDETLNAPGQDSDWTYIVPHAPAGRLAKLRMVWRLVGWLRRERPAVIICAMQTTNVLIPALARLFSRRSRIIVTHHSPVHTSHAALDRIDGLTGCLSNVSAIVAVAPTVRRSLAHKSGLYLRKVHVIRNALSPRVQALTDRFAQQAAQRAPGRTVVAIGRLSPEKNIATVVEAARHTQDVRYWLVGDGPGAATLAEQVSRNRLDDTVLFLGQMDSAGAMETLSKADIFVQVSLFEGHSLALIEAARMGKALIVSDIEAQRDAVTLSDGTVCAAIVPATDAMALANAIRALLDVPGALKAAQAASARLGAVCNREQMIDRYQALVDHALTVSR